MDIEWAKDGRTGELFIVQARPETVHARAKRRTLEHYRLTRARPVLVDGPERRRARSPPDRSASFRARADLRSVPAGRSPRHRQDGSRLGADHEEGRRHRHQSRRAHVPRRDRQPRAGRAGHRRHRNRHRASRRTARSSRCRAPRATLGSSMTARCRSTSSASISRTSPRPRTKIMMNVGNPDEAFALSFIPNDGVGLARIEFIISNVHRHPPDGAGRLRRSSRAGASRRSTDSRPAMPTSRSSSSTGWPKASP